MSVDTTAPAVLDALERQSQELLDRVLEIFLEFDFLEHRTPDAATGGEVVTHLAREADRMADELAAATGQRLDPIDPDRDWSVEQGGGLRPGAVLVHDLHESAARLRQAITGVDDWTELDEGLRGIPRHRLRQVILHAIDLDRPWESVPPDDADLAGLDLPGDLPASRTLL